MLVCFKAGLPQTVHQEIDNLLCKSAAVVEDGFWSVGHDAQAAADALMTHAPGNHLVTFAGEEDPESSLLEGGQPGHPKLQHALTALVDAKVWAHVWSLLSDAGWLEDLH